MDIDPRRGAAFLAAIDSGSLEQAAVLLHITPSAVSQRISALEDDLGMPLLVRTRPCRPTAPGMRVLQFLRRRALLEAEFAADMDSDAGPVKIALAVNNDTLATWLLPVLAPPNAPHKWRTWCAHRWTSSTLPPRWPGRRTQPRRRCRPSGPCAACAICWCAA